MTQHTLRMLSAALALAACGRPPAPEPEPPPFRYYPSIAAPEDLAVIDLAPLTPGERTMLATVQGIAARRRPSLWLRGGAYSDAWQAELERRGVRTHPVSDPWEAVRAHLSELAGSVVFDPGTPSENVATTLAGLLGAAAVPAELEGRAEELGLARLADARPITERQAFEAYQKEIRRDLLFQILPTLHTGVRDLAALTGAFVFFDPSYGEDQGRYLSLLEPDRPVFGWGDESNFEHAWVLPASQRSAFTIPCGAPTTLNLTALAGVPASPRQKSHQDGAGRDREGVHTVTFLMSDGDNIEMDVVSTPFSPLLWASPARGKFPLGWTISPTLADLAPVVLEHMYQSASAGRDYFVAGVSGAGYFYPDRFPGLADHVGRLGGYLRRADLRVVNLMIYTPDGFTADLVAPYAALDQVDGGLAINYALGYDLLDGKVVWSRGKPFVGARYALCKYCSIVGETPEQLVESLNQQPRDPSRAEGYSFVIVQNFSYGVDDVARVVAALDPAVEVVAPDELIGRMKRRVTAQ